MSHSFLLQTPSNTHASKSTCCDALTVIEGGSINIPVETAMC
jgi:hypothetical protein